MNELEAVFSEVQCLPDEEDPPGGRREYAPIFNTKVEMPYAPSPNEERMIRVKELPIVTGYSRNDITATNTKARTASPPGLNAIPCFIHGTSGGYRY